MSHPCRDILSLDKTALTRWFEGKGEKPFRASQLLEAVYKNNILSYDRMTTLPALLRAALGEAWPFPVLQEEDRRVSKDGTVKFLWSLSDGERIETVFIPTEKRNTLCISSQAGCKFACAFCASGANGWKRNLSAGEIIGQVLAVRGAMAPRAVTHVVFMGVGEPFDNYDAVMAAVRRLNASDGLNIAARRITISTCGLVSGIARFAKEGLQVELSVSLHSPEEEVRTGLMPVNKRYPLKDLMAVCRAYAAATDRQVTFEYILIKGVTVTPKAAARLAGLMAGWLSKVNLIPYNKAAGSAYEAPSRDEVSAFKRKLEAKGVICTLRAARGGDVAAACGQLRYMKN